MGIPRVAGGKATVKKKKTACYTADRILAGLKRIASDTEVDPLLNPGQFKAVPPFYIFPYNESKQKWLVRVPIPDRVADEIGAIIRGYEMPVFIHAYPHLLAHYAQGNIARAIGEILSLLAISDRIGAIGVVVEAWPDSTGSFRDIGSITRFAAGKGYRSRLLWANPPKSVVSLSLHVVDDLWDAIADGSGVVPANVGLCLHAANLIVSCRSAQKAVAAVEDIMAKRPDMVRGIDVGKRLTVQTNIPITHAMLDSVVVRTKEICPGIPVVSGSLHASGAFTAPHDGCAD